MSSGRDLDALARELEGRQSGKSSLLLFLIFAVIVSMLVWASLTEIDDVTRATGKVVPAGDVQRVQANDEGVIREVFVEEGQIVEAGVALVELDGLVQNSQLDREVQRSFALRARIARLTAEIEGRDPVFDEELSERAPEMVVSERALFSGRAAELSAEIGVLERRLDQRRQERAEVESTLRSAERISEILEEEYEIIAPLVENGVEPRTSLLTLQRRREEEAQRISQSEAQLGRLATGLVEIEDTIEATRATFRSEALAALADATAELNALKPSLPALQSLAERAVLRAPMRGVVNRLHRRTIGGTVRSGEDVVEIVPIDDTLLIEAYVLPQDIAFINPGMDVRVNITAYDFRQYGSLDGSVERLGANAIQVDQSDSGEVFVIDIRTDGLMTGPDGQPVQIIPGMTADVSILAGKRHVIDYILFPLERLQKQAFRD